MLKKLVFQINSGLCIFLIIIVGGIVLLQPTHKIHAQPETPTSNVYLFYGNGCPHCAKEKEFLREYIAAHPKSINLYFLEVYYNQTNAQIMAETGKKLGEKAGGVPYLVIGKEVIVGFSSAETTGTRISSLIDNCKNNNDCPDEVMPIILDYKVDPTMLLANPTGTTTNPIPTKSSTDSADLINLPIIGELNITEYSLPVLTIILGFVDGFNPCAMWVLLYLISLLINLHDRRKMWLLGITFIVTSAVVYFVFLAAWLNLFLYIGYIFWIRLIIGTIAIVSGFLNLKKYFTEDHACQVIKSNRKQKIFHQLEEITRSKKFILAIIGIILLAISVNMLELVCSAGIPAIYTNVLSGANLSVWQYYSYLSLYIFVFMVDDLFVFILAMKTLKITGISTKYTHYAHLIGGIVILIIGILLILRPDLLLFG